MLLARLGGERQVGLSATVRSEVILRQSCDLPPERALRAL
jgi:hypothetical protein